MAKERGNKLIANNKKAYFDYFIEEKYEAGIALAGTEVKSVRQGHCSIKESFISIDKGEIYIYRTSSPAIRESTDSIFPCMVTTSFLCSHP